jgi:hypothetical protein
MANGDKAPDADKEKNVAKNADSTQEESTAVVLSGAEKLLDGQTHTGVAVLVTSDGKPSTLMVPDITKVTDGAPVYITKPIRINGQNLKAFLAKKNVNLPEKVTKLIEDTMISCEAFYYSNNGPLLMVFAIKFEEGLIGSLTGEPELGALFDIQGASVRVLRCPQNSFDVLKQYAAGLAD